MESSGEIVVGEVATVVAAGREKRHRRSDEERRRIVEETLVPGASVARVARAHGVNANQVFGWRRLYRQGKLGRAARSGVRLLPVSVSTDDQNGGSPKEDALVPAQARDAKPARSKQQQSSAASCGAIHIQLPKAQVRVEGAADPATLRAVLECLLG